MEPIPTPHIELSGGLRPRFYRGAIYHPLTAQTWEYWPDGGLVVSPDGRLEAVGPWTAIASRYGSELNIEPPVVLGSEHLLVPGLIDLHLHLPQLPATGRQAEDLLAWLDQHIFKTEAAFAQRAYAQQVSRWFFQELLKNGTTTAAVFLTLHREAVEIAFEEAERQGNRVIMGLNLMDRLAPPELTRPTEDLLEDTEALCRIWHGRGEGRLRYAWMPRFAVTSTETLLTRLGALRRQYPDVYLHTHLSEQVDEIETVLRLFPQAASYTDVYDRYGLLGPYTILAHGIHLTDGELALLKAREVSLAHCPSANFFLKSGRFRLEAVQKEGLRWGLGSDVGAGPEMSLFKVMKDAQYMQPDLTLSPHALFYATTLGAARALFLEEVTGNLTPGKEADFLILNTQGKSNIPAELGQNEQSIEARLSQCIYLGDDRLVAATFVRGQLVYCAPGFGLKKG
jgi:guanine deaminase